MAVVISYMVSVSTLQEATTAHVHRDMNSKRTVKLSAKVSSIRNNSGLKVTYRFRWYNFVACDMITTKLYRLNQ